MELSTRSFPSIAFISCENWEQLTDPAQARQHLQTCVEAFWFPLATPKGRDC